MAELIPTRRFAVSGATGLPVGTLPDWQQLAAAQVTVTEKTTCLTTGALAGKTLQ
jgi:hypothetical protein